MKWTNKEQIGGAHWVYDMDTGAWVASVASKHVALVVASPELRRLLGEAVAYLDDTTAGGWILEAKTLLKELEVQS